VLLLSLFKFYGALRVLKRLSLMYVMNWNNAPVLSMAESWKLNRGTSVETVFIDNIRRQFRLPPLADGDNRATIGKFQAVL
jgi:hypothetical protein